MAVSSDFLIITFTLPYKVWRRTRKALTLPATGAVVGLENVTTFYNGAQWQVKHIGTVEEVKIVEESFVHMRKVEDLHLFILFCRPASPSLLQFLGSSEHLLWFTNSSFTIDHQTPLSPSAVDRPDTYLKADLAKPLTRRSGWCSLHLDKAEIVESEILQTKLSQFNQVYLIVCCNKNSVCPYTNITQIKPGIQAPSRSISYLSDIGRPWPCFHPRLA